MKILYDISFITQKNSMKGISVHSLRLLRAIPIVDRKKITLLVDKNYKNDALKVLQGYNFLVLPHFRGVFQHVYNKIFGKFVYKHIVDCGEYDALIVPDEYRPVTIQKFKTPKFIFSHDLKGTKDSYNSSSKKMRLRKKRYYNAIKSSELVFAISEYTKNDIKLIYPNTDMGKVFVIYNSIEMPILSKKPEQLIVDFPYILTVNHLDRYKNALTSIKAFSLIAEKYLGNLVIVSKPTNYWYDECLPYIKQKRLEKRIVLLSNLPDEELKWLYENANLFISSSSHEGFGFTPIEAAICFCPVICTDAEALPETTMGLLNYYTPPTDESNLANKMMEVLSASENEQRVKEISKVFMQKYSPSKQVEQLRKIITEYFKKKNNFI